jgi:hypothetical protein
MLVDDAAAWLTVGGCVVDAGRMVFEDWCWKNGVGRLSIKDQERKKIFNAVLSPVDVTCFRLP